MSSQERREAVQKKRLEIVNYIHKYYKDPKTKRPHPVIRIENALDEIKAKFDPDVATEKQANILVDKIVKVLPITRGDMTGIIKIPLQHVGSAAGVIKKFCPESSDSYDSQHCTYTVGFLPGDYDAILSALQKATQGNFTFDVEGLDSGTPVEENPKKKGKGGKKGKK